MNDTYDNPQYTRDGAADFYAKDTTMDKPKALIDDATTERLVSKTEKLLDAIIAFVDAKAAYWRAAAGGGR